MDGRAIGNQRKRVLIVGAGAAGMSCAHHLANHPDKFDVTLVEASNYCGGQAFSIPIDKDRHGASWLNQGVQGGSYIFHHTMTMFARQGFHADPVELQVSFGKDDTFWSNVYPTKLIEKHQAEIRRFYRVMKIARWFEIFFMLLPIKLVLALFRFSHSFSTNIALPMLALFLGTGNETPAVPTVMLERLCTSPTYGMWYPLDRASIVSNLPPMVVFPNFSKFYETWRQDLIKRGVKVRLSTEVTQVMKRDRTGVTVGIIKRTTEDDAHNATSAWAPENDQTNADAGAKETFEEYDELVLCTLADTSLRLLGKTASFLEKLVLSSATFSDDITITHADTKYIAKHYEETFNPALAVSTLSGVDQTARLAWAKKNFRPMYLIKPYDSSDSKQRGKLEMCFNCSNYQPQFPDPDQRDAKGLTPVYQTIFLNARRDRNLWTDDGIDESKVIRKDWWHQLCHTWKHYVFVVPWVWLLQSRTRRHTRFAGSWTLVNAHEIAVMSGTSAAVDLGAEYPSDLAADPWARLCFRLYSLISFARWRKMEKRDKAGESWASGDYGSVYKGPGLAAETRRTWTEEQEAGRSL